MTNCLFERYGKNSDDSDKPVYVLTPIAQASLNISARYGIEDVCGPNETPQRMARIVRFDEHATATFIINIERKKFKTIT